MKKIFLYEPSIGSENVGDQIIVDSIKKEMASLLSPSFCIELPTHLPLSNRYMYFLGKADYKFVCGSNIIVGDLNSIIHLKQWNLNPLTYHNVRNAILVGVGAQQYNQKITIPTRLAFKWMFGSRYIHSVRDSYTEQVLKDIGIKNVINTACPTMWSLTKKHCSKIPTQKADKVIFTLTDYKPDVNRDEYLISILKQKYSEVYFWPQGHRDFSYFKQLNGIANVKIVNPHLNDYDSFLDSYDVDFIGTRLHGGIRALQKMKRTIIIGIDNRAIELNKDFNIPVLNQNEINNLGDYIESDIETDINIPKDNIANFLSQFKINYND